VSAIDFVKVPHANTFKGRILEEWQLVLPQTVSLEPSVGVVGRREGKLFPIPGQEPNAPCFRYSARQPNQIDRARQLLSQARKESVLMIGCLLEPGRVNRPNATSLGR
jgi:hypothetical protein